MSDTDNAKREPYSITRLNDIISESLDGINKEIWPSVLALADLTGYNLSPNAHIRPLSAEDPSPMIKAFELAATLREAVNQVNISLTNLGHDLNPEYYEKTKKDVEPSEI
ncbi:hypothetical protein LCGC14_0726700 [marine sediment metagenome]|uniref:Uncharacterized protein n=1 Tax=marine sediment metagenome TaxID=412755 RepID=A0A0F9QF01_9ZZZZ